MTTDKSELATSLIALAAAVTPLTERILVEDTTGRKYRVIQSYAIGTNTDDPGILVRIQEVRF